MALLDDFLQSPQALAMAGSLLSSSGPSPIPINLGQAVGQAINASQKAKAQDLKNKYTQALAQQAALQNQQMQTKIDTGKQIQSLIGTPAQPATQVPFKDIPGTGLLGGQITQDQFRNNLAGLLAQENPGAAVTLLNSANTYSKPYPAVGDDGKLHYFQINNAGQPREIPGYSPLPRSNTQLSVDPTTGAVTFTQGAGNATNGQPLQSTTGPLAKDVTKSPARGGQGGTYVDANGNIISTDTSKQTSQDQATVAAIQRLEPMMDTIISTLPQFQTAYMQGLTSAQGIANKYFGTNYSLPSEKAAGESQLNAAPDPLLKILGIPSTDEGLKTIRGIIAPQPGESPQYYKQRVIKELSTFRQNYLQTAKNRLAYGTNVGNVNDQSTGQTNAQPGIKTYNPQTGKLE